VPLELHALSVTEVDRRRNMEGDARVAVLVVVPVEEASAENSAIFDGAEAVRELERYLRVLN
jgi:hypothetical protein